MGQKRNSLSDIPQIHSNVLQLLKRGANKRHGQTCSISAEETAHDEFFELQEPNLIETLLQR